MAKKLPAPENHLPELAEGAGQAFGEILSTSADQEKDAVLAAGIDLGRIEAMDFVATVATHLMVITYESVMKSKGWKYLRNPKSGDGSPYSSLEEFCEVKLGRSYRRLRELLANKKSLGQEAFEQAEQIGLRQADYNVIKALPAPKQEIIKEALADGATKEEVQRALRELAAADQKEIEALAKDRDEAQENYTALEGVNGDNVAKITKLEEQLKKRKLAPITPDALAAELVATAHEAESTACAWVNGHLRKAITAMLEHDEAEGSNHRAVMSGLIARIEDATDALRLAFALPRLKTIDDDPFAPLSPEEEAQVAAYSTATPVNAKG